MKIRMAIAASVLTLSSGAQAYPDTVVATDKSLSQICQDIENRGIYTVYDYVDHLMTTEGKVKLYNNSNVNGRFRLRGDNTSEYSVIVNADPEDVQALHSDEEVKVHGVITGINTDDGCVITINTRRPRG